VARVARSWLAIAAACAGCSGEPAGPAPQPPPLSPPQDAAAALPGADPASGPHPDEGSAAARVTPARSKNRPPRPIDVTLKSDPRGALAAVDGRPIGTTPTFWAGESDGLEHEFTFNLAGHASARYRFVPITSGVLYVKLQPVAAEPPDGGLGPVIAPKFVPDAAAAPPAPPPPAPDAGSGSGSAP
jgi:hypothetical protein